MLRFILHFIIAASLFCFLNASSLTAGDKTGNAEPQQIELDSYPGPVGGFAELMKNIVYPESGKKSGITGKTILALSFNDQAKITKVEVVQSLGSDFDKAAIDAVKKVTWTPAMSKGKPVECQIQLPIEFKLEAKK
jgi:protein TonB